MGHTIKGLASETDLPEHKVRRRMIALGDSLAITYRKGKHGEIHYEDEALLLLRKMIEAEEDGAALEDAVKLISAKRQPNSKPPEQGPTSAKLREPGEDLAGQSKDPMMGQVLDELKAMRAELVKFQVVAKDADLKATKALALRRPWYQRWFGWLFGRR